MQNQSAGFWTEKLVPNNLSPAKSSSSSLFPVSPGVTRARIKGVMNAYFIAVPENNSWVLVDTAAPASGDKIQELADEQFGANARPTAIVLTHGHFDHAGSARELAERWQVPIYAHKLEFPYLTGKSQYPPQDPNVEGAGAFAFMARFFTRKPFELGDKLQKLNDFGNIEELPGWKFLHTPGHTAGHISLFRESDRTLIAGDAIVTVNQDNLLDVMRETPQFYRPPAYFTPDWEAAYSSIQLLADLEPHAVGSGHGPVINGANTAQDLKEFARNFRPPRTGRYAKSPAITDETGVVALPPPAFDPLKFTLGAIVAVSAGVALTSYLRRPKR